MSLIVLCLAWSLVGLVNSCHTCHRTCLHIKMCRIFAIVKTRLKKYNKNSMNLQEGLNNINLKSVESFSKGNKEEKSEDLKYFYVGNAVVPVKWFLKQITYINRINKLDNYCIIISFPTI